MAENSDSRFIRLTAQIVSAYLGNNSVPSAKIPALWQIYSLLVVD
jgi:predicted transcriptional regulator